MARLTALFCAIFGLVLVSVGGAPPPAADVSIGDIVNLLNLGLVTKINAFITLQSLETNLISVNFDVKNPLILELTIDRVVSQAGLNGTVYATFDQTFTTPVVVPILGTANSGTFDNVLLTQGATNSLDIIPYGVLDLMTADVYVRAATIKGKFGIPVPIIGLKQSLVPTTYMLDL